MQGNRQSSVALNGRDLASLLGETDREVVNIWTSNMTKTHKSTFRRLKEDDDGKLSRVLQDVLRFRGLRYGAGNWDPILAMRCREVSIPFTLRPYDLMTLEKEVYAYLHAIAQTWEHILGTDLHPDQLDETTVLELQMYLPAYSTQDCDEITKLFVNQKVFPFVQDVRARESIGRRVLSCKRIVTFNSFFNDFIYLRTCFDGLKALLPSTWKTDGCSFEQALAHNWQPHSRMNSCERMSEGHFEKSPDNFRECYADLWLFAMREFPYLSDGKASRPLHDGTLTGNDTEPWSLMGPKKAQLAHQAFRFGGFETDEIEKLKASHPIEESQDVPSLVSPKVSTNHNALNRRDRSNRPSRTNYTGVRAFLYRSHVYDTAPVKQKKHATAYAVAREIVHCYWRPDIKRWLHGPEVQQESPDVDMEQFSRATHTEAPRSALTRPFSTEKISKQGRKRRAGRNLNKNQKFYEMLMSELREDFAVRGAQTRANSTSQHEWNVGLQGSARISAVKEEVQQRDDFPESIENEHSKENSVYVEPLKYTVKAEPHTASESLRSEGSVYSVTERRLQSELDLFETKSESQNRDSEAVMPEQTTIPSPSKESIEKLARATCGLRESECKTEKQYEDDPAMAIESDAVEYREDSYRESPRKQSRGHSRSVDSGSTSWPRLHHDAAVSNSIEKRNGHQPTSPTLDAILPTTKIDIRKRKRAPATLRELGQSEAKEDALSAAESSRKDSTKRQTIFPGKNREVKADVAETANLLRRRARQVGKTGYGFLT